MMYKIAILAALLPLMIGFAPVLAQDGSHDVEPSPGVALYNSESFEITSTSNGEDYVILVSLPEGYATSEESYPVLYVLDPLWGFGTATSASRLISENDSSQLPPLIIVGIGYPLVEETGAYNRGGRTRDYNSRPVEFLDFLEVELIPLIDSIYRTQPGERGITGHSSGGRLVVQALAERTELFDRYIAISASELSGIGRILNGDDEAFRASLVGRDVRVFITASANEGAAALARRLGNGLEAGNYEGLTVTMVLFEDETHLSVQPSGLTRGMRTVFGE